MAEPAQPVAELKKLLNAARGGEINFAVCLGKDATDMVLLLDRSKGPRALAGVAKSKGATPKVFFGDLTVDSNRARFMTEGDPPAGALPQMKKFFELHKLGFNPEFGTDLSADIRDGVEKESLIGSSAEMSPQLKLWRKADARIEAAARTLMKSGQKPPHKAMAAWKEIRKRADRGDLRLAIKKAPQVIKLMQPANTDAAVPKKGKMLVLVKQMAQRLKGKMTPKQEKFLKAAANHARKGADDKAAALLRAAQKAAA